MGGMFREGKTRYKETGNILPAIYPLFFGAALILPLTMLGWDIRERFKILSHKLNAKEKSNLYTRVKRLLHPEMMGQKFKVIFVKNKKCNFNLDLK